MKQTLFTLLLLSTIGITSCRKSGNQQNIKQYDDQQIQNYISANALNGLVKDTIGGDTSGIYYKIIMPGSGAPLTYSDNISFVFTLRSFDGKFNASDTILNHFQGYVGHIVSGGLPEGLELAILNDLKYHGGSMRLLIPSRLAYGVNGYGSGSITNVSTRIAGNQCLDYYVHIINNQPTDNQATYDDQVIKNYLSTNTLTSQYTLDSGVYYNIQTPGTGTSPITDNTTLEATYNGRLLNNTVFDAANPSNGVDSVLFYVPDMIHGVQSILKKHATKGTVISMIVPSGQAYGQGSQTSVPVNSCLRFEFTVVDVSP